MTTLKWTHWAVGLIATAALSTALVTAADRGGDSPVARIRDGIHARLVALGITGEQREQIRAVLREFKPTVQPMVTKCIQERRALREIIQATPVNEAAIRAQSAKVAAAEADIAVARGRIVEKIRPVLTAEQLQAVRRLEEGAYARIDESLGRLARWIDGN
ncbi:MAG: periplasmic heavy metal sensor [Verrucomicrobiota bacterium]